MHSVLVIFRWKIYIEYHNLLPAKTTVWSLALTVSLLECQELFNASQYSLALCFVKHWINHLLHMALEIEWSASVAKNLRAIF